MKTNLLKYYIAAFYICSTFVMVAQSPGDGNGGSGEGALEGADAPAAPIDGYVYVLALIGLAYVFFRLRAFAKQANGESK